MLNFIVRHTGIIIQRDRTIHIVNILWWNSSIPTAPHELHIQSQRVTNMDSMTPSNSKNIGVLFLFSFISFGFYFLNAVRLKDIWFGWINLSFSYIWVQVIESSPGSAVFLNFSFFIFWYKFYFCTYTIWLYVHLVYYETTLNSCWI